MTNIDYAVTEDEFHIEAAGHAGYAESGKDIVCAAISILTQTLVEHLNNVTDEWNAYIESGNLFVYAKGRDAVKAFRTILTGLRLLQASYPQYVKLNEGCTIKKQNRLE